MLRNETCKPTYKAIMFKDFLLYGKQRHVLLLMQAIQMIRTVIRGIAFVAVLETVVEDTKATSLMV